MFACEYSFFPKQGGEREIFLQDFWPFVGALGKGGQTVNEDCIIQVRSTIHYICICPEKDSLNTRHHTSYAAKAYKKLLKISARKPHIKITGEVLETPRACQCKRRPFLYLFTHFLDRSSPAVCGKCRQPVPLYRLPRFENGAYDDILGWQEIYRNCDSLFMESCAGEMFGYRQMSDLNSELTILGRKLCTFLERKTGVPVFYHLHRYYGKSSRTELKRRCPGCNGQWLLNKPMGLFDFCCKKCRLFSVIAPDCPVNRTSTMKKP